MSRFADARRYGEVVREKWRFALRERSGRRVRGVYHPRGADVRVVIRHGTGDRSVLHETWRSGEYVPPRDLSVTFTEDEEAVSRIDMEVMGYVWQRNLYRDLRKALDLAPTDPGLAGQMLHETLAMARRVGNSAMERRIKGALEELDKNGTVSIERRRTITLGGITHTIKTGPGVPAEMPSYEEARDLTGA